MNPRYWQDGMGFLLSSTRFSATKAQVCRRIALPFWGQVFGRHGSTLSSNRLFGARFSAATAQLCRRLVIAFLGPGFRPPRLNFVVESPFWGQVFSRHGSTLSSNRLFGARFSAATAQLCRRLVIAFLGPGFQSPRLNFVVDSPFWGRVFSRHGSTLSSTRLFGASAGSLQFVSIPPQPTAFDCYLA